MGVVEIIARHPCGGNHCCHHCGGIIAVEIVAVEIIVVESTGVEIIVVEIILVDTRVPGVPGVPQGYQGYPCC